MISVATVFYKPREEDGVPKFARCYTWEWVEKLYRGVARNYSHPFNFSVFTDTFYLTTLPINQYKLRRTKWDQALKQLYGFKAERLALFGLDTIITGSLDELFSYNGDLLVPRDPYNPSEPCNAVVLCPTRRDIEYATGTDMSVLKKFPHDFMDDLYPKQVVSYKCHVQANGVGDARIVYFHGEPKPHNLDLSWVKEHWR